MSTRAEAGKRSWRHRAPGFADELRAGVEQRAGRARIERDAARRFERWLASGRLPLWLRLKRRLRRLIVRFGAGNAM